MPWGSPGHTGIRIGLPHVLTPPDFRGKPACGPPPLCPRGDFDPEALQKERGKGLGPLHGPRGYSPLPANRTQGAKPQRLARFPPPFPRPLLSNGGCTSPGPGRKRALSCSGRGSFEPGSPGRACPPRRAGEEGSWAAAPTCTHVPAAFAAQRRGGGTTRAGPSPPSHHARHRGGGDL